MHKLTHLRVAKLIKKAIERESGIELNTRSFLYGNIKPDISYRFIKIPHSKHKSFDFLKGEIQKLTEYKIDRHEVCTKEFSRKLGIITHFISDFFCHAHKKGFYGNAVKHFLYEFRLNSYFKRNAVTIYSFNFLKNSSTAPNRRNIPELIEELHYKYSKRKSTYARDIIFALKACICTAVSIVLSCMGSEAYVAA
ncbi:MAG: zinc dependent phospholipase C family protein [Acetivibrionales bacterium]